MSTAHQNMGRESGAIGRVLLIVLAILVIGGAWLYLDEDAGAGLKKDAKLKTMEIIGEKGKALKAEVAKYTDQLTALKDRYGIYVNKLKELGVDLSAYGY